MNDPCVWLWHTGAVDELAERAVMAVSEELSWGAKLDQLRCLKDSDLVVVLRRASARARGRDGRRSSRGSVKLLEEVETALSHSQ